MATANTDAAVLLTAAFTGWRASELRALRWRSVPLMPQVALALTKLRTREFFTDDDDLVFCNEVGKVLDYDKPARRSARRWKRSPARRAYDGLRRDADARRDGRNWR